jgi:hypothetical protein
VHLGAGRLALGLVFLAGVGVFADEFLLLRINADHRLVVGAEGACRVIDVVELGVSVHVLGALFLLGRALEAIAHLVEQLSHRGRADIEALGPQRVGQLVCRLGRPAQRGHRITPCFGRHQVVQFQEKVRVLVDASLAARTLTTHPVGQDGISRLNLSCTSENRVATHVSQPGHRRRSAMTEHVGHSPRCHASLAFVEEWIDRGEELSELLLGDLHADRVDRATYLCVDP